MRRRACAWVLAACLIGGVDAPPCFADAALSTEVSLIPTARGADDLSLSVTESFAASRYSVATERAGDGMRYDLRAVADGTAPYDFEWRCSIEGGEESIVQRSEGCEAQDRFELSARAFTLLRDGATHRFTVKATDAEGRTSSASIVVVTSSEYAERSLPRSGVLPRLEGWWVHDQAQVSMVELEPASEGYELLRRKSSGRRILSAWRIALVGPDIPAPLHVGLLSVHLPAPSALREEVSEIAVLGIDETGGVQDLVAQVGHEGGKRAAVFETEALGYFALLAEADEPIAVAMPAKLSARTGDAAALPLVAYLAATALATALVARFMHRCATDEKGAPSHGAL